MNALGTQLLVALTLLAQGTLALMILTGLLAVFVRPVRRVVVRARRALTPDIALWVAFVVAATATAGSLYFSEVQNFIPCQLCWFERICMYPLTVIFGVGAALRDRRAWLYGLPLAVVGLMISAWHMYIEANPEIEACTVGVPCSTKWIDAFGYITIPTMAATAFALIIVTCALLARRPRRDPRDEVPA